MRKKEQLFENGRVSETSKEVVTVKGSPPPSPSLILHSPHAGASRNNTNIVDVILFKRGRKAALIFNLVDFWFW